MAKLMLKVVITLYTFQLLSYGQPIKTSFRGQETETSHVDENKKPFIFRNKYRAKKEPIKAVKGKRKDSLEYELDHVLSEHNLDNDEGESSPHNLINFYSPDTGIDRLHTSAVDDAQSTKINEPHFKFDYNYDNQDSSQNSMNQQSRHRVDSYAGEMIDDENTLSKYIAPPVFENNQNRHKIHEAQMEKMLYGTPQAADADSSNTQSFLQSLGSLMTPLSMANKKSIQDFEQSPDIQDGQYHDGFDDNNSYKEGDKDYKHDNHHDDDEDHARSFFHERKHDQEFDENNHNNDESMREERRHENREHFRNDDEKESELREREERQNYRDNENHNDDHDDNRDGDNDDSDHNNDNDAAETRSSKHHEDSNYENDSPEESENRNYNNERDAHYDRDDGENEEDRRHMDKHRQQADKPIEMVQDDTGKLHPLSKDTYSDEIRKEIQRIMSQN